MKNIRLTNSNINKIKKSPSSGSKIYLWDMQVRGFGAYKTTAGRVSFVYQYKTIDRRTASKKLGEAGYMSVDTAREIAAGYSRERRQGIDPFAKLRQSVEDAKAAERLTIANYFESYLARLAVGQKPMTAKSERSYRRDLIAYLGDIRLDRLTNGIIEAFGVKLAARGPSMVRIGYGCLKTIINNAVKRGAIKRSAVHDFDLPAPNKRKRRLGETEFVRVYEAGFDIEDVRADAFEMILRTAKRKEEVAQLPWEEIDLDKRQWRLPAERNKPKRNVLILLPRQVVALLERLQPDPAKRRGPVFTLDGVNPVQMGSQVKDFLDANLHRRLELAAEDGNSVAFEHWTVHDTRKVPASILCEKPYLYSRDVVNAMLVHKVGDDLDETYMLTQLVEEAGDALQTWNDHMDELLSQADMWPGGRRLRRMKPDEQLRRVSLLRRGWPKRADQKRAEQKAAADPSFAGPGGADAARKRRTRAKAKGQAAAGSAGS